MDQMEIERMAENYALGTFLTDWDELTYNEIMDSFARDEIPEQVIIWLPFEGYSCESLIEFIENLRNDYLNFSDRLTGVENV
jgi:hypothetical protein